MLAVLSGFAGQYIGRLVIGVLLAALVLWVEALLMNHTVQLFFRVIGIELILLLFIGWIFYMLQGASED
ncbi:MAG: hypothetical protein PHQ83_12325 [Eubacteriales bacterium]|nr:hypothetical protein [Eubacteriales bacterium]